MTADTKGAPRAAYVVLQSTSPGEWKFIAEVPRRPGLPAQAARTRAIAEATSGRAKAGEIYAAVPRSEWRIAQAWDAPDA